MPHIIQTISRNLSTKVKLYFHDVVKTHLLMINNVNIFTIYESLLRNAIKFHFQLTKLRLKFRENIGFNYKLRLSVLTVAKMIKVLL